MISTTKKFDEAFEKKNIPDIKPGDVIKVYQKVKEGDKERIQIFEGLVLARKHGKGVTSTFTVRKVSQGVGVERIFPLHSPLIDKIEIVKSTEVRRAKLYFLRSAKGKKAKLKAKKMGVAVVAEPIENKQDSENIDKDVE